MYDIGKRFTEDGSWLNIGDGAELLIARAGNKTYLRELNRLQRPYAKRIAAGTFDPVKQERLLYQAIAKGIVLDWKGIGENNAEIPYTETECVRMLSNNPVLLGVISDYADDEENYALEKEAETVKKSAKP